MAADSSSEQDEESDLMSNNVLGPSVPDEEKFRLLTKVLFFCLQIDCLVFSFRLVADLVRTSDMLFVGIGAGMGADSGLKVFKEIADVPAYQKRKLVYSGKLNGFVYLVFF